MKARKGKNSLFTVCLAAALISLAVGSAQAGALGQAVSRGDLAAVNALLLKSGIDLDERDGLGTPLHRAIMGEYYRVARRLIAAGANLNIADEYFGTPLYLAVRQNNEAAARLLIAAGADLEVQGPLGTPLHIAAQHDFVEIVTLLLEKGAEPNSRNRARATPLALALWKGGLDAAKVLVEKGADIEAKDLRGQTPAFYAAASPNAVNAVAFLIEQGAEINLHDATGVTPLAVAVKYDRQTAIKILRAHGAVD